MKFRTIIILLVLVLVGGCGSNQPVVPTPPSVRFSMFSPIITTPKVMKFKVKLTIHNRMRATYNVDNVKYAVDLNGRELFASSYAPGKPIRSRGNMYVTIPFQIALKDMAKQGVDILADHAIRIGFRGSVLSNSAHGFAPVPFESTKSLPLPRLPIVSFAGVGGRPFSRNFVIYIKIKNTNRFPMDIRRVSSFVRINGRKYDLLATQEAVQIAPGSSERLAFRIRNAKSKSASMVLNILQSHSKVELSVGGSIECNSPYGLIYIPVELVGHG